MQHLLNDRIRGLRSLKGLFHFCLHRKHGKKQPTRQVHLYFDHPKAGCQGVKILEDNFGESKRLLFCFDDEGREASKIIEIYLFIGSCFVIWINGICPATNKHISEDQQCGQFGPG